MSKIFKEGNYSIGRELKIDENAKNNYSLSEIPLNSVTQKFLKEPLTLETFDKKFRQMYDDNKKKEQEEKNLLRKNQKDKRVRLFFMIYL